MTLAVDSTAPGSSFSSNTATATITVGVGNADVVVGIGVNGSSSLITVSSVSDGVNTYTLRSQNTLTGAGFFDVEAWAAKGVAAGTYTITVTATGALAITVGVISLDQANTTAPWDVNVSLPAKATGTLTTPSVTGISTTNTNTLLLAVVEGSLNSFTTPAGFTSVVNTLHASVSYQVVTSAQSSATVTWGSTSTNWAATVDAVQAAAPILQDDQYTAGRFFPAQYYRGFAYNTRSVEDGPAPAPKTGYSSTLVVTYDVPRPPLSYRAAMLWWGDLTSPPVKENNQHWLGKFVPTVYVPFRNIPVSWDQVAVAETNQHWVGKYVPAAYFRQPVEFAPQDLSVATVQPDTGTRSVIKFSPAQVLAPAIQHYLSQDASISSAALVLEQNPHWVGTYHLPQSYSNLLLRHQQDIPTPIPAVETNPHTIGRFQPSTYPPFRYAGRDPDGYVQPPIEGRATIGKFYPIAYSFFRPSTDYALPAVAETNPHTIGRFSSTTYSAFRYASRDVAGVAPVSTESHSSLLIVTYDVPRPPLAALSLAIRAGATDVGGSPVVAETNTNAIGKFSPPVLRLNRNAVQNAANDPVVLVSPPETNVSTLGRFVSSQLKVPPALRSAPALDTGQAVTFAGYSSTLVVTYDAPRPQLAATVATYYQAEAQDTSAPPPVASTTATGLFGRLLPPVYSKFAYGHGGADVVPALAESNTHFVPPFVGVLPPRFLYFSADVGPTAPIVVALPPETYSLGKFSSIVYQFFRFNYEGSDFSQAVVFGPPETYSLGKFSPTTYQFFRQNYEGSDFSQAGPGTQPETNPHFISQFSPTVYRSPQFGFSTGDIGLQEGNTHVVGDFYRPQVAQLQSLWNNAADDTPIVAPLNDTNPHHVGQFSPTKYIAFPYNFGSVESQPIVVVPDVNPHFISKFSSVSYQRFPYNSEECELSAGELQFLNRGQIYSALVGGMGTVAGF